MHRVALALTFASFGAAASIGLGACAGYEAKGRVVDRHARGVTRAPDAAAPADEAPAEADEAEETKTAEASEGEPVEAAADGAPVADADPVATDDGRTVTVLRAGDGPVCEADSLVRLRYEGRVQGGRVFDRSAGDEPAGPWPVAGLMPGLRDSLVGAASGARLRIVVPPALGYGDAPVVDEESGEQIVPANATLVYTVELVEVIDRDGEESADG